MFNCGSLKLHEPRLPPAPACLSSVTSVILCDVAPATLSYLMLVVGSAHVHYRHHNQHIHLLPRPHTPHLPAAAGATVDN